jgi:hypothetical protein
MRSALQQRLSTITTLLDRALSHADEHKDSALVRLLEDAKRAALQAQTESLRSSHTV